MTYPKLPVWCTMLLAAALFGCGGRQSHVNATADPKENRVKVCGFKDDHGVFVNDEVRRALGVAIMEVASKTMPQTMHATARVFAPGKASILVPTNLASSLKVHQRVLLDGAHQGSISALESGGGHTEAIVTFGGASLPIGAHLAATLQTERNEALPAVPQSSLLAAASGDYVFVANGEHLLRTPVTIAGKSDGWLAIADGLVDGDLVVTNGVQGLWCIELQATKGGYACCAVAQKE